jgi:hypothetical protein
MDYADSGGGLQLELLAGPDPICLTFSQKKSLYHSET